MRANSLSAILVAVALLTGCGHDTTAPLRPVGAYRLDLVNGTALPSVVENTGSETVEITAGSVSFDANGTFAGQVTVRQTVGTVATTETDEITGTFILDGNGMTFTEATGETYTGVFSGSRVTAQREGTTFEFVKQ